MSCWFPSSLPILAALLLSLGLSPTTLAQAPNPKIDSLVEEALREWSVPGAAVVIVRDNKLIYLKGFGVRDHQSQEPVTTDTVFALASCSKAFTTLNMAMLVDKGKMNWDDPVRRHLPYFRLADPLADQSVTLRDLVCHRTGVGGHDLLWYRVPWSMEEVIRKIGLVKPSQPFRASFQYQSIMFCAAGEAVAAASGSSWSEFVKNQIFEPLGMTGASCTTAEALRASDHATPHRRNKQGKLEVMPWYPFDRPNPSCSINASARDLARWLQFQLGDGTFQGKRLVSQENLVETHTPQNIIPLRGAAKIMNPGTIQMSYGMGWVVQDYLGHRLVSHGGRLEGLRAHITLAPDDHLGLVVLSNLDGTVMNYALSNTLIDHLLGLPYQDWNDLYRKVVEAHDAGIEAGFQERQVKRHPGTKPSHPLADYTGTYEDPAYGKASVVLENGSLVWCWNSFRCPLQHYHFDTFIATNDRLIKDPLLEFILGADGEVSGLRIVDVDFKKVKKDAVPR